MTTYTLTSTETELYDSSDDRDVHDLMDDLIERFGPVNPGGSIEVVHPDGFVINAYGDEPEPYQDGE